jgi:hypothetical protein
LTKHRENVQQPRNCEKAKNVKNLIMFGKTKFPGKPSKLVHKKRVSVLSFDNNFDSKADNLCENDDGKILASQNNNHGFQVCLKYAKGCAFLQLLT